MSCSAPCSAGFVYFAYTAVLLMLCSKSDYFFIMVRKRSVFILKATYIVRELTRRLTEIDWA